MTRTDLDKDLLRPAEVAAICQVSRNTIYRWLRAHQFGRVRIGGCTFIRGAELRACLNSESGDRGTAPEVQVRLTSEAEEMLLSFRTPRRRGSRARNAKSST